MIQKVALLPGVRYRTMSRGGSRSHRALAVTLTLLVTTPMALGLGAFSLTLTRHVAAHASRDAILLWVHLAYFLAFAMLLALPIVNFAAADFYDITKLFHLPVSHRSVFVAQILGMMSGGSTLFFLPALLGIAIGASGGAARSLLSVPLLLLFLFQTVAFARLLQLLLLNSLGSRRFRDLAAIGAACLSAGLFVLFRLTFPDDRPSPDLVALLDTLLASGAARWIVAAPSSWITTLMVPGAGLSDVLVVLLVTLPLTALVVAVAAVLQERAFHGEVSTAPPRTRPSRAAKRAAGPGLLRFLPEPVRAMARTEIHLVRREPVVKTLLVQQTAFLLIPLAITMFDSEGASAVLAGPLLRWGFFLVLFVEAGLAMNVFGLEGPGIVATLSSPTPRVQIVLGKALAYFLLLTPVNVLFVAAMAALLFALTGTVSAASVALALVGAVSATLVLLGGGLVVSVLTPMRLTSRSRGALAQSGGADGCLLALARLLAFMVLALLMIPIALFGTTPALAPLSLAYGALMLLAGTRISASYLAAREEALMLTLARSAE